MPGSRFPMSAPQAMDTNPMNTNPMNSNPMNQNPMNVGMNANAGGMGTGRGQLPFNQAVDDNLGAGKFAMPGGVDLAGDINVQGGARQQVPSVGDRKMVWKGKCFLSVCLCLSIYL